jgi:excisionase family DNA binding protein
MAMTGPRTEETRSDLSPDLALGRRLLSVDETAHALHISGRHLRDLISRGHVRAVRLGRRVLVPREELDRLAREGTP